MFAMWYGEFDSNIIISSPIFNTMVRGKATFYINNTFLYFFPIFPSSQGVWRIKWIKPNMKTEKEIIYFWHSRSLSIGEYKCHLGIGGPGEYKLITSFWDRAYIAPTILLNWKIVHSSQLFFVGLDVKLP